MTSSIGGTASTMETAAGLSDFAQHVLRQICSQEWVLERCLQNPEELCHTDMLLDSMLTPKQVRHVYIYTFNDIDSS
jgi:mediator of RNA polymerase II transcription subunit 12